MLSRLAFSSRPPFDFSSALVSEDAFHLRPHYRAQRDLDALLLKSQAGSDDFITEKYQDQIAVILAEWSASLLRSPQDVRAIERVLAQDFSGSSLLPVEQKARVDRIENRPNANEEIALISSVSF